MCPNPKRKTATIADWEAWPGPDTQIVEVLDGELVVSPTPSPWHQDIVARLNIVRQMMGSRILRVRAGAHSFTEELRIGQISDTTLSTCR